MTGTWLRRLSYVLTVVLAVVTFGVLIGRSDQRTFPSMSSARPSGLWVLGDLLRERGVTVVVERRRDPEVRPGDVLVMPLNLGSHRTVQRVLREMSPADRSKVRVVGLVFEEVFDLWSLRAVPQRVQSIHHPPRIREVFAVPVENIRRIARGVEVWGTPRGRLVEVTDLAEVTSTGFLLSPSEGAPAAEDIDFPIHFPMLLVHDALGATNRFIDRGQNAEFFVELLSAQVGERGRLLYLEAEFGNEDRTGLLARLGPWARAAGWQLSFLGLIMAWTLGTRFGSPLRYRTRVHGTRDLIDAYGFALRRTRMGALAREKIILSMLSDLRIRYGLPRSSGERELFARLDLATLELIRRARTMPNLASVEALRAHVRTICRRSR